VNVSTWLPALAFVAIVGVLLLRRFRAVPHDSVNHFARVVGAQRAWGESDDSLRRRSIALSRWPYEQQVPVVAWYARAWGRIRSAAGRTQPAPPR
jgi:hypothetical protein